MLFALAGLEGANLASQASLVTSSQQMALTCPKTPSQVNMTNGPFAASDHMVHAGGQAAHWDIQNKENSNLS